MPNPAKVLLVLALALDLAACCGYGDTLFICGNPVTLHFNRAAAIPFRVELRSLRDSVVASRDCSTSTDCDPANPVISGGGDTVFVVRVTEPTRFSVDTVRPTYQTVDEGLCRPRCLKGDAAVRLSPEVHVAVRFRDA